MSKASDAHNAATLPILRAIIDKVGANPRELLVFAATMVAGLFLVIVKLGGDEPVLEVFMDDVKDRLARARLGPIVPKGDA